VKTTEIIYSVQFGSNLHNTDANHINTNLKTI